jgi:hypothetical protein
MIPEQYLNFRVMKKTCLRMRLALVVSKETDELLIKRYNDFHNFL